MQDMKQLPRIILIGCGRMGLAMLKGWLTRGIPPENILVVEQNEHALGDIPAAQRPILVAALTVIEPIKQPVYVVLAVKPQIIESVLAALPELPADSVVLSIAAGVSIARIRQKLSGVVNVVRTMPNLPASIGVGITVAVCDERVTEAQKATCDYLLQATGRVLWAKNEDCMDAVTALSGSGPAYVFHLIETMEQAGRNLGLDTDMAKQLAVGTVYGSACLAERSNSNAASLREQVTSPKGTTQAALDVLMHKDALQTLMLKAMTAARDRSVELRQAET